MMAGSLVVWDPPGLHTKFSRKTTARLREMMPVRGMVKRIDGNIGLISCMGPDGLETIPVLVSELQPAVHHGSE